MSEYCIGIDIGGTFTDCAVLDEAGQIAAIGRARLEPLAAKQRTLVGVDDAIVMACAGGGFGDPIEREPERVRLDVKRGLCSAEVAARIYGVVLSGDNAAPVVDDAASAAARTEIRARRLAEGRPVGESSTGDPPGDIAYQQSIDIGSALRIVTHDGWSQFQCGRCDHALGAAGDDPKLGALAREVAIDRLSPWNEYGLVDEIVVRELCCPSCAHLIGVETRLPSDPVLLDTLLAAPGVREAAE